MVKKQVIPAAIVSEIEERVEAFNQKHLARKSCKYVPKIKGKFIYLMQDTGRESLEHICRVAYNGDLEDLEFAIYKYSSEKYDPNEFFFPGSECLNGTIEGAMKAGLKAYPV
jgi:hypothetical protein